MKVEFGKYVALAYAISVVDNGNDVQVYKFDREHPDGFVFGQDLSMIEGFVRRIEGLNEGDTFDFTLEPAEAFGDRHDDLVMQIPKDSFVVDGKFDDERVRVGAMVPMQTDDGYRMDALVTAIDDKEVTLDFNHQLAGERVHYVGEVVAVREATPEELAPKGGCGCGCGCDHHHDHGDGCDCDGCKGCE